MKSRSALVTRWGTSLLCLALLSPLGFTGCHRYDSWLAEQLSRPGALEFPLSLHFDQFRYELFDAFHLQHDWPVSYRGKCALVGSVTVPGLNTPTGGIVRDVPRFFEKDGQTWQVRSTRPDDPRPISHATHSAIKLVNGEEQEWGYRPLCSGGSVVTHHLITIQLNKRTLSEVVAGWQRSAPGIAFSSQQVGSNRWTVGRMPELLPRGRGYGGPHQVWILPLGDTGYTWIMTFGANQESLKYPDAHATFERVIEHMVGSVRVEPMR